ncbi:unnamed protein product [Microthlaspi erraticum]|uniref:Uncharacterized protein n=1 Tax=Microthlaspi erraticum TaxID=1685480 RepID=A0A6D2J3E3_9BRAS|nr:unnamed protein product [Microthlaspi erraticum]
MSSVATTSYEEVFGYSMEKRIVPRCNVIEALLSRGLLGSKVPAMSSVLVCTDQSFLKKYVKKHDDDKHLVLVLMDVFNGETRT